MTKGMVVISIPLAAILWSVVSLYIFQQQRASLNAWIERAFQAGSRIQMVLTLLSNAEVDTQKYLQTGDTTYLQGFQQARLRLPGTIVALRKVLSDSPVQLDRIERVESLSQKRMTILQALVSQPRSSRRADEIEEERRLMDSIQREFAAIRKDEAELWITRIRKETTLRKNLSLTLYAAALVSLLAGGLAMALFVTGIVQRSRLLRVNAERLARGEVLADLPPGTDEIGRLGEALSRSSDLLYERETELRNLNHSLDQRVRERTAELEASKEELYRAKEAAEAASQAKSTFLATVSHEIRTPMNGVIGMTEVMMCTEMTEEQREHLGIVRLSANALLAVINDILDFSKLDADKIEIEARQFDLHETVTGALKTLTFQAHEKGLHLDYAIDPNVPAWLVGDAGRLRQILLNLLGNAIKFSDQGAVTLTVECVSQGSSKISLHFAVTDTGIGIPADKQQKIFEPFSQADGSYTRRYGGTGLGLSIASRLVEMMGGRIWLESEVGRGSTFHFTSQFGKDEPRAYTTGPTLDELLRIKQAASSKCSSDVTARDEATA